MVKISSSPNVEAQPWSPLPKHLRAIPAKVIKRNHYFNQFILKRETRSQSLLIQKSVNTQTLQSGLVK